MERDVLREPKQRVVRVVGRDLLARVRETAEDLNLGEKADALHDFRVALRRLRSWIRAFDDELLATVRPKAIRRLKRIADATRTSRDLEVKIEWVERFSHAQRGRYRQGAQWLSDDMRAQKAKADADLLAVLGKKFDRAVGQLSQGLGHYVVDLDEEPVSAASALAELIRDHAEAAARAMTKISSVGVRAEAHQARIAIKRLRYLVEPVVNGVSGADTLVDDLSKLQDALGALHDAQMFGSDIAKLLAKVLAASSTPIAASVGEDVNDDAPPVANDRAEALRAMSQRLHREERKAFDVIRESWLAGGVDALWGSAERVATELSAVG
jgi:CHAD domain-containing protein